MRDKWKRNRERAEKRSAELKARYAEEDRKNAAGDPDNGRGFRWSYGSFARWAVY